MVAIYNFIMGEHWSWLYYYVIYKIQVERFFICNFKIEILAQFCELIFMDNFGRRYIVTELVHVEFLLLIQQITCKLWVGLFILWVEIMGICKTLWVNKIVISLTYCTMQHMPGQTLVLLCISYKTMLFNIIKWDFIF